MNLVYKELITCGIEASDYKEAIQKVGKSLEDNGFVKDSYIDAVIEREAEYPTGLILKDMNIAMPHTAGAHVNTPAVCIAKLTKPVVFGHMGDPDTKVDAELLFMMAIKNPDDQIDTLKNVMGVFTNSEAIEEFKSAQDIETLYQVSKKYIDQ